ncbi:MAG: hypothetical protein J7641_18640 [Cyanobacteria bacterium SID2]|nr:hypothetical protein [Cyanobacteria bacterium SID2]
MKQIINFIFTIFFVLWFLFFLFQIIFESFGTFLHNELGVSWWLVQTIALVLVWVLIVEVYIKILIWRSVKNSLGDVLPVEADLWYKIDHQELERYTKELQSLGFIHLMDYTYTSPSFDGRVRLFSHPKEFCFAEVAQTKDIPMFCSMSCFLEQRWIVITSNYSAPASIYALNRRPRDLRTQKIETESAEVLMKSLLAFRQPMQANLNLEVIQETTAEFYFEQERQAQLQRQASVARKSLTWTLLEVLYFSFNPPLEWLGEYAKIKRQRAK